MSCYWKGKKLPKSLVEKRSATVKEKGTFKGGNNPSAKRVICVTTNKVFDTMKEASEFYNCNITSICSCCKGKLKSAGKHPETGEKLIWKYAEDN